MGDVINARKTPSSRCGWTVEDSPSTWDLSEAREEDDSSL